MPVRYRRLREWYAERVSSSVRNVATRTEHRYRNERCYALPDKVYLFGEAYRLLGIRVDQFYDRQHWGTDPPEKYCRAVTNIEASFTAERNEIAVQGGDTCGRAFWNAEAYQAASAAMSGG